MQKKNVAVADVKNLNLLTIAGIAVKNDGSIETMTINPDNLAEPVTIISPPRNTTLIKSIHTCKDGILVKLQGSMTREVKKVVNELVSLMSAEKLDESLFPGYVADGNTNIFVGNKVDVSQLPPLVADATLCNNKVYLFKKSDLCQLHSIPLVTLRANRNWITMTEPVCSFTSPLMSLGRISVKNQTIVVSMANKQALLFSVISNRHSPIKTAPAGHYLGNFKLSKSIDHAVDVIIAGAKMVFVPARAAAARI